MAKELPDLLEEETDLAEASQRLKESKQRFWEKRTGKAKGKGDRASEPIFTVHLSASVSF